MLGKYPGSCEESGWKAIVAIVYYSVLYIVLGTRKSFTF